MIYFFFFFNDTATTEIYTLSLHDALPIYRARITYAERRSDMAEGFVRRHWSDTAFAVGALFVSAVRSEEHTSELQSQSNLVCRLLLEKKKNKQFASCCRAFQLENDSRSTD